jgi:hypothetical protein
MGPELGAFSGQVFQVRRHGLKKLSVPTFPAIHSVHPLYPSSIHFRYMFAY